MLCALIMAGGKGTRFWPKSTDKLPKQFINLISEKSMLQLTYDRINKLVDKEHIFIVTNKDYYNLVKEQINGIKDENIILEPCSKNTAPCILLSSFYIKNLYGNANIVCLASDNTVENEDKFINNIQIADDFVTKNKKAIVTLGIKPTRPETGYGYIKYHDGNGTVLKVDKFVEKPNYDLAVEYLNEGHYLWNAGLFIFNIESMLEELKINMPNDYQLLEKIPNYNESNYEAILEENYAQCQKISIDYAVMEKSNQIYTIPSDIGWDDVGSWQALERYLKKDDNGNIKKGNIETIKSQNNIIYGNDKKIILLDVNNLFCIDTDEVLIIGNKEKINEIYELRDR